MKRIGYIDGRRLFLADGQALSFGTDKDIAVSFNASLDALEFAGDIYLPTGKNILLASGGVINFGAGDVTITHSANLLTIVGGDILLSDALKLHFGDDKDFSIYWTGGAGGWLNIVALTGGSVSFYAPGGILFTGPVTMPGDLTIAATFTVGAVICNGNMGVAGTLTVVAYLTIINIPVADPHVPGQLWDNDHIVTRSWG